MNLIQGITLDQTQASLQVGDTLKLNASIQPADATESKELTWTSSDEKVATVNSEGVVTAISAGKADITVMTNGGKHRAAAEITVTQPAVPEEDEKDTPQPESNNDSNYENNDQGTKTEDTSGNALPETATANYQFLLWGTVILVSGGILLVIYKRKSTINE